jgi:disulfide bond formation protein DsbB
MKKLACFLICNPKGAPLFMAAIAAAALAAAYASQYWGGLEPCILCLYQRWPYWIIVALGLTGFAVSFASRKLAGGIMGLIGLSFFANSAIAFYHTGVEQKWWRSFLEGCAVPELQGDMDDILAAIEARSEAVRCDAIAWADPVFGLSMANYNVIVCFVLGCIAVYSAVKILKLS